MESNSMETPSQRQVTQGPHSSAFWSRTAKRTRVTPKPRWYISNNIRHNDNNSKRHVQWQPPPLGQRGRQRHVQRPQHLRTFQLHKYRHVLRTDSPPTTSTATLNTIRRTATLPTTRHRQQKERRPQAHLANAIAQTSAQDELTIDCFSKKNR